MHLSRGVRANEVAVLHVLLDMRRGGPEPVHTGQQAPLAALAQLSFTL